MPYREISPDSPQPPLHVERWPLRARLVAIPFVLITMAVAIGTGQLHYMMVVFGGIPLVLGLWSSYVRVLPGAGGQEALIEEGWGLLYLPLRRKRLLAAEVECVALRIQYVKLDMGVSAEVWRREGEPLPLLPMVTLTRARAAGVRAAKLLGVPFDQRPLGGVLIEQEDVGLPLRDRLLRHPSPELKQPPSPRVSWDAARGELHVGDGVVTIDSERIEVRDKGMFHHDGGLPTARIATALVCKVRGFGAVSLQGQEALVLVGFGEHGEILSVGCGLPVADLCWARHALERAVVLGAMGTQSAEPVRAVG